MNAYACIIDVCQCICMLKIVAHPLLYTRMTAKDSGEWMTIRNTRE